jgi:hypothetical protein
MKKRPIFHATKNGAVTVEKIDMLETTIVGGLSRTAAKNLATKLNSCVREATFKPKSHGGRSRRKGHQFERDVAISLRDIFPEARRHLEYQDQEANGVDLIETGHFRFQCKKLKSYAPVSTIDEIESDRMLGEIPVVVTAADDEPWMAVLHFDDLLSLIRESRVSVD